MDRRDRDHQWYHKFDAARMVIILEEALDAPPETFHCDACEQNFQMAVTWPQFVNAYDHNRAYGGPEEGGWWFDTGTALASIPCENDDQIEEAKVRLRRIHGPAFEGNHEIGSVLCEGVLLVVVEDEPAEDFPKERPHYE